MSLKKFLSFKKTKFIFLVLNILNIQSVSYEYPLFYRAPSFWGEPRLERNLLFTSYGQLRYGSSKTSRGPCGYKTNFLNIHGFHNMLRLGAGLSNLDSNNKLDKILLDLNSLPFVDNLGQLSFYGKLRLIEANINLYQNIYKGFFVNLNLPFKYILVNNISYKDLSPQSIYLNYAKNTPAWQAFLNNFDAIMNKFNIEIPKRYQEGGFGDFSVLVGWALNHEETEKLDFIDTDIQIGVQFPTSSAKNLSNPFILPIGYPSIGVPIIWDFSIGAYEWLTFGSRIDGLFLSRYCTTLNIKTEINQTGMIKLAKDHVNFCPGSLWHFGVFLKADHIVKGWSALLGYSYNKKDDDQINLQSGNYSNAIANTDSSLKKWDMHTIHMLLEKDFCSHHNSLYPRVAITYDHVVAGQRIVDLSPFGAYVALDIEWRF